MMKISKRLFAACWILLALASCVEPAADKDSRISKASTTSVLPERSLSSPFENYWYSNQAEITSYHLEQARYGQRHTGRAVLIFVTEPFDRRQQVKENDPEPNDPNVLKCNSYKRFFTGMYPYTMMNSTFMPVKLGGHALKITQTVQEWCGQAFMQLNNRGSYRIRQFSYFQSEGDTTYEIDEQPWLEDELWNLIRLAPGELPTGQFTVLPSLGYLRLRHQEAVPYAAQAEVVRREDSLHTYKLLYPALQRSLRIHFQPDFPHTIEGWEETYYSGFGARDKKLTTRATRHQRIRTDYWNKNGLQDSLWRDSLGLEAPGIEQP